MERVRGSRIPVTVVGCTTDTLVPTDQCRRVAGLLGSTYHELELPGGHVWMPDRPRALAALLPSAPYIL